MTLGATLTQQQAQVRLSAYLSGHGLRLTKERMSILATVWEQKRPFAAADLVAALEAKGFHVSRSTAYQTLTLLCDAAILCRLMLGDEEARYTFARRGYIHLVCRGCGKIREEKDPTMTAHLAGRKFEAFTPDFFSTVVYGTCSVCRRRSRKHKRASSQQTMRKQTGAEK